MAASDKPFHNQRTLDIVFAVSNILMLLSVVWMMWADYAREYKAEQRVFREVEVAMAQRIALQSLPTEKEFTDAETKVKELTVKRKERDEELKEARKTLIGLRPDKERAEAAYQAIKAEVDSKSSFRDIDLEHAKTPEEAAKVTEQYDKLLKSLNDKLAEAQKTRDEVASKMKAEQLKIDDIQGNLTKAIAEFKKVNDKLDAQVKLAINKRWGWGDWFRTQPVINGFADPLKIHQFTINDIPIDYNFKQVTRYDRCMSCHLGIDRPSYTRENLMALTKDDPNSARLDDAKALYKRRIDALDPKDAAVIPNPNELRLVTLSEKVLTPSRITEFAAHPRLDLYVGSNSKHPAEKFGCTSCHSGQGSGTSFTDASHTPNSMSAGAAWAKERGYEFNHMWDFQMHSKRFVEASCIKCHHEVTDLISSDNRVEAPKLLRGHTLIKENGCFGCHEISGWKSGQRVGPDLRLEPNPPLEVPYVLPVEIDRAQKDTDNRPGTLRKVGPSLARVSEKVNQAWIEKWLRSPSAFRPDTKMPHYYGLSTNDKSVLMATAPEWEKKDNAVEKFPDTEMASIAHFLTVTSKTYLAQAAERQKDDAAARKKDEIRRLELINKDRLEETDQIKEQTELAQIKQRMRLRMEVPLVDLTPKGHKPSVEKGRDLFIERGCLACHTHQGTEVRKGDSAAIASDATFGPNLSQVAEKFAGNTEAGRKWLIQWIIDPQVHSPRSRMPVTHLKPAEAADIAAWLLAHDNARVANDPWTKIKIEQPKKEDLHNLARVYLMRMLSKSDMERFLNGEFKDGAEWSVVKGDLTKDEQDLRDKVKNEDDLKYYLGKKAVTRLGCFGCHDIPGFENTKSIGVGLNDWGKKPADRLAFDDIDNFYKAHYHTVDSLVDENGKPHGMKDGKEPYESFFTDALTGHHRKREGFLNQKIRDPRSYDYNRIRAWDDRSRMPKFTFARPRLKADEKPDDFKARIFKEEAEAREAVATFVLGLTAEQVPTKSINTPAGDREKEVKGRQVLDKYNCAGCHQIRPGVYDFKIGKDTLAKMIARHEKIDDDMTADGELRHNNHINYVGRNPLDRDRTSAFAIQPEYEDGQVSLRLSEAFRFSKDPRTALSFPAATKLRLPIEEFGLDKNVIKTQEDFERRVQNGAPYGGTFTDLMVPWLQKKDKAKYPEDGADARAALPPSLVGQGERTQSDWLTSFLLNPTPVRRQDRMVLRMPKFNLSPAEAKTLVDYFAAVTRQTNPGIGLVYPSEIISGRDEIGGAYWRKKNEAYIKYLKKEKLYDAKLKEYTRVFEQIRADSGETLARELNQLAKDVAAAESSRDAKKKQFDAEKDEKQKPRLDEEIKSFENSILALKDSQNQKNLAVKDLDVAKQQDRWEKDEAYAADAYRMLMSRDLCTKCHQIGGTTLGEQGPLAKLGPNLDLASSRLRPEWVERWVNKPHRFLPYASLMPAYFSEKEPRLQNLFAGPASEQIPALRDVLMNYPQLSKMPINQAFNPDRK